MKKIKIISFAVSAFTFLFVANSCSTDSVTMSEDTNINMTSPSASKNASEGSQIYYLTQEDLAKCRLANLTNTPVYNNQLPVHHPTITTPKWYSQTPNSNTSLPADDWYFVALQKHITTEYLLSPDLIKFNTSKIVDLENDPAINKATINIYPNQPYYDFVPQTYISAATATAVMHVLFLRIEEFMRAYKKPMVGITLYIEHTMCGGYAGMSAKLYYGDI